MISTKGVVRLVTNLLKMLNIGLNTELVNYFPFWNNTIHAIKNPLIFLGIRQYSPWLASAEEKAAKALIKPTTLDEATAMYAQCKDYDDNCVKHLKILENASAAAQNMTTHKEADEEVKAFKERHVKVKEISDVWMKKADTLLKEWKLLDNTVNELNSWVAKDRGAETEQQNFSLEKMESTLGELKNIFKQKEKLVEDL